MKKALTIYVDTNAELAYIHGTLYIKKDDSAAPVNVSFTPPDSGAVLLQYGGEIMAVADETGARQQGE